MLAPQCRHCGFQNGAEDRFCGGCGSPLDSPQQTTAASPVRTDTSESVREEGAREPLVAGGDEAQNRQITVLLCDIVNWTTLSRQIDGEDLRDVIRKCQDAWNKAVDPLEGFVARYMGDAALVYFGYPQAHEDDPERALRAGLAIVEGVRRLETEATKALGIELQMRVGIATGPVVVGDVIGEGASLERAVVGETPNLAARLQTLAAPNQVIVSDATHRIIGQVFDYEDLGRRELKGFDAPVQAWRVIGESAVPDRFEATHSDREITPLIGREEELDLLMHRWQKAVNGEGQVAIIEGQPGIGKSRLTQALRSAIDAKSRTLLRYFCTPYHQGSALFPLVSQMERAAEIDREDPVNVRLDKLEALIESSGTDPASVAPLFASLMSLPIEERYGPLKLSPQQQRERTYDAFEEQLRQLASRRPVLVVFEDVHWADPSTLEILDRSVFYIKSLPVFVVLTFRPETRPTWVDEPHVTTISLNRLSESSGAEIVSGLVRGKTLPDDVLSQIIRKADGIPLFVEEVTKTVLESGFLKDRGDHYEVDGPLPPMAVPSTLHDSLMARLDRLAPVRDVAQLGAVIGRRFNFAVLSAVSGLGDDDLFAAIEKLVDAELIYSRGGGANTTYTFKHALVRDAAYGSMLRSRRRYMHGRVADVLEKEFSDRIENEPEVLAHHLAEAGESSRSIYYLHEAGKRAIRRSANREAIEHLSRGLELLRDLGNTPANAQTELDLQIALGSSLTAGRNYAVPEVERAYARAEELSERLEDRQRQFVALRGLWNFHYVAAHFDQAETQNRKMLQLAESEAEPAYQVIAHQALGQTLIHIGDFEGALESFKRGIALAEEQPEARYGRDSHVFCYAYGALALWCLGEPALAVQWSDDAVARSRELERPFVHVQTLGFAALLFPLLQDVERCRERAQDTIRIAEEFVFPYWSALAQVVDGWAECTTGDQETGIARMQSGLDLHAQAGAMAVRTWFLTLLADCKATHGSQSEAMALLEEAAKQVQSTGERMWEAELWRIKGSLEAQSEDPDMVGPGQQAEQSLAYALQVARGQKARSWELKVARSLSELWLAQDRQVEARALLQEVVAKFDSGAYTRDLDAARTSLEALGSG